MSLVTHAQTLRLGRREWPPGAFAIMAVINRTPDSFFDQGATREFGAALDAAGRAVAAGADIVDIGGVKAGPGDEVGVAEEIRRVAGLVAAVRDRHPDVVISVDTWRAEVGEAVAEAGADLLNDVWGGADPRLAEVAAAHGIGLVCSHAGGLMPRAGPHRPAYADVTASVIEHVTAEADRAVAAGVRPDRILIDPAHDFGKNTWHSLEVTRRLGELTEHRLAGARGRFEQGLHRGDAGCGHQRAGRGHDRRAGDLRLAGRAGVPGARRPRGAPGAGGRCRADRQQPAVVMAAGGRAALCRVERGEDDRAEPVDHFLPGQPHLDAEQVVDAFQHHQAGDGGELGMLGELAGARFLAGPLRGRTRSFPG